MTDTISCEEAVELNADAVASHGEDSWVGHVTVCDGFFPEDEDLVECEGFGEQWFRPEGHVGDTIDWCRKCYKNDPYYC